MTRTLIVPTLLVSFSFASAADKDWAGKVVMPKRPELKFGQWQGNRQTFSDLRGMDYTVKEEKDGWLLLRLGEHEGWGLKTEWVLLQDAPVHYTARLRQNKDEVWSLQLPRNGLGPAGRVRQRHQGLHRVHPPRTDRGGLLQPRHVVWQEEGIRGGHQGPHRGDPSRPQGRRSLR